MALGFAGYLLFMKATKLENDKYFGEHNGKIYPIVDDLAGVFYEYWKTMPAAQLVKAALSNEQLWGEDLTKLQDLEKMVLYYLEEMISNGVLHTVSSLSNAEVPA